MKLLGLALREIVGMFIDDGQLALWATGLIAALTLAVTLFALPPTIAAAIVLIGCVAILVLSVRKGVRGGAPASSDTIPSVLLLFAIGALLGSAAPVVAMALGNQGMLQLMLAAWRHMLFNQGWWPWSLAGGVIAVVVYQAWKASAKP